MGAGYRTVYVSGIEAEPNKRNKSAKCIMSFIERFIGSQYQTAVQQKGDQCILISFTIQISSPWNDR